MEVTTIGQRIAAERKRLALSQEAFGEKMGVSRQAISKWEADGAVPEIDKLIAMSKLFGVSVGWLLGVEEASISEEAEPFSEKQLEILESIIRRYRQPEPAPPSRVPWILAAAGICAALILGITALRRVEKIPNYSGQLNNISGNYSHLQSQLSSLAWKLEELAQGERLLTQYEFTGEPMENLSGVRVRFTATPKSWQPGDQAELSIRRDDMEIQTVPCGFSGSAVTAQWELPGDAGYYSYCFIRYHEDGSQEQQILDNVWLYAQEPRIGLQPDWQGSIDYSWDEFKQKLTVDHIFVFLGPPGLLRYEDGGHKWADVRLTFLLDGQPAKELDLMKIMGYNGNFWETDNDGWFNGGFWPDNLSFTIQEDSLLEAVLTAEFNGKYTFQQTVSTWQYENGYLSQGIG